MRKKVVFIAALLLGILIGLGIGIPTGIFYTEQSEPVVVTNTPVPTATNTPAPTATNTPAPTATNTPVPTATNTPAPTATRKPESSDKADNADGFYGALHVEGTHLAAEDGALVQLRGISTHGLGWFPGYVNEAMIAQARQEWGCNVLRLAMYTAEYNGYCTSGNDQKENLKKLIDTGIQAAIEQEMYIIIDWHVLSDGNPNTHKEEAKRFFGEMAKKYADVPNVIYEICNEPNGGTDWSAIRQYALEVIPVIRKYAPEAVIIVGTPTWSQDVDVAAKDPITEYDNIMYALHFYAATHKDNLRDKCKTAVAKGLPLFVTEYGICDASGGGAIDKVQAGKWINLLDSYGISHVMWNLSNKSETCAMIKSSCNKTANLLSSDLSPAGVWFVNMMKEAGLDSEDQIVSETEELFEKTDSLEITGSNSWVSENGYSIQLNVVIKNNKNTDETDWIREVKIRPDQKVTVSQCWCAKVTMEDGKLIIRPEDYNKTVPANGEVGGIGIILEVEP